MWALFVLLGIGIAVGVSNASTRRYVIDPNRPDFGKHVDRALSTIRQMESGNDYQAENPNSSASGAYQFLDTTWGDYRGYGRAKDAPPSIQDAKARRMIGDILIAHGYDFRWIPAVWYAGNRGASQLSWDSVLGPNRSTIQEYVNRWIATFRKEK